MKGNPLTLLWKAILLPLRWCKPRSRYTEEDAILIGKHFGMEHEVRKALRHGYNPDEALQDWDIYPYTEEQYNEWIK